MSPYRTLWLTERSLRHQQNVLAAAPPELDVVVMQDPDPEALRRELPRTVFLVSERSGEISAAMIAAAPRLQMVLRLGSLTYDIDLAAARRAGVVVCARPVGSAIMVAEHVVMQMLALARRLRETQAAALVAGEWGQAQRTDENVFAYNWSGRSGIGGLWRKTIGILGFGEIGVELARRLHGWDCDVLYHRRRRLPAEAEAILGVAYAERDHLLAASDYLVNLLPYSAETDHSLATAEFARLKPGACVVSCGSGSVIDEGALAEALRYGHLSGAALDTYEWEPLMPDNPLRRLALGDPPANVLLTPHTAGLGASVSRAEDFAPILQFLHGEPLRYQLT